VSSITAHPEWMPSLKVSAAVLVLICDVAQLLVTRRIINSKIDVIVFAKLVMAPVNFKALFWALCRTRPSAVSMSRLRVIHFHTFGVTNH
jgi:hypothetical protein